MKRKEREEKEKGGKGAKRVRGQKIIQSPVLEIFGHSPRGGSREAPGT